MDPRRVPAAVTDQRVLPLAHQLDLVVDGAWPVEAAVAQRGPVHRQHLLLDVLDRQHPRVRGRADVQVERIILGLDPPTFADAVPARVALRDHVRHLGRRGRGQQVVGARRAEPDRPSEPAVHVLDVGLAGVDRRDRRHLVDDDDRGGLHHGVVHGLGVEPVHHNRIRSHLPQQVQLRRARGRRDHLVPPAPPAAEPTAVPERRSRRRRTPSCADHHFLRPVPGLSRHEPTVRRAIGAAQPTASGMA
ncbi:hypothetical protein [Pseudonocardia thermophila]|uniref:hypothetical protein n=1 Tax=Pseudonocardia thermophila TaxID=1848 RepID=UPI003899ED7F